MKKTTKLIAIALFAATTLLSACKKEEEKPATKPVEEVMTAKFEDDGLGSSGGSNNYVMVFRAGNAGKITHLGARTGAGTYNLALIDSSSLAVLRTASVTVTDSTKFSYSDIEDIDIAVNKTYYLSMHIPAGKKILYYFMDTEEFPVTFNNFTFYNTLYMGSTDAGDISNEYGYYSDSFVGIPGFIFVEK
ncbi:MAG: hypothetical protein IPP60_01520 [Sphingobacteriales bacterium]|nr:hypothetical protein [Sphingobacteriales bacterium]MBP8193613.1 hypothetical protein [Chitinophagales bacterium]